MIDIDYVQKTVAQKNLENEVSALKQFNELFKICKARYIYDINCDNTETFQRNVLRAIDICVLEELYPEMVEYRKLMIDYAQTMHTGEGVANKAIWRGIGNLTENIKFLCKHIKEQKGANDD